MPHIIVQNCCNDASCVPVCPVDCIHPTPDEPDYTTAEMLYIDPEVCIDCGACVDACPVGAITADNEMTTESAPFEAMNAAYYAATGSAMDRESDSSDPASGRTRVGEDAEMLRVAVVGGGAAGHYVVSELLERIDVRAEVDVYERLAEPGGLVRFGVAPDHGATKRMQQQFAAIREKSGVRTFFGVQVGRDIAHEDLAQRYHAVVYAVGALNGRSLPVPGGALPAVASAAEFVAWLNGHPEFANCCFDLSQERVVVLGNGNVALDVARILTAGPDTFASTDMTASAVTALCASRVREVVVLARRGPEHAAFTTPELVGVTQVPGVRVVVEPSDLADIAAESADDSEQDRHYRAQKLELLRGLADAGEPAHAERRIVLRFGTPPVRIDEVGGRVVVEFDDHGALSTLDCGIVLAAIGLRGSEVAGIPFDENAGVIPNRNGRVLGDDGVPLPGVYAAGWIKRGPTGVIGTNKLCAWGTVDALIEDFRAGRLRAPTAALASVSPG